MKRVLAIVLCLCMIFTFVACTTATTDPEPAEEPVAEGGETGGEGAPTIEAETHEPFTVNIAAGRPGDTWYVLSYALASFINSRSEWLRAEVSATAGIADDVRMVAGDPELQKKSLVCTMVPGNDVWGAEGNYLPKLIAMMAFQSDCFITLDPKMTLEDMQGKNIALPRDTAYGNGLVCRNFLKMAGVTDYNYLPDGNGGRLTALQDGAADVGVLVPDFYYPDTFTMGSGMLELSARGTLYFPLQGRTKELLPLMAEACKSDPFVDQYAMPPMVAVAPAGSFGEGQTEDVPFFTWPIYLAAGDEVPDYVIREVLRIYYEAAQNKEFEDYHACGKGITPEFCAFSPWEPGEQRDRLYHPAALAFYEEVGQEIKSFSDLQKSLIGE